MKVNITNKSSSLMKDPDGQTLCQNLQPVFCLNRPKDNKQNLNNKKLTFGLGPFGEITRPRLVVTIAEKAKVCDHRGTPN